MKLVVQHTLALNGEVVLPGSKSESIRGLLIGLLAEGESTLVHFLDSEDTRDAKRVCQDLGAVIHDDNGLLKIDSHGLFFNEKVRTIHTGNSGITTHFILPLLGLRETLDHPIIVNCGDQMRKRPIHTFMKALNHLGLTIQYLDKTGKLPVAISGRLRGGACEVDGITSQYLSALLLSLPCVENNSIITVHNLQERPYLDMTMNWLSKQNIKFTHRQMNGIDEFIISGNQRYQKFTASIPGDFSSAANLIAAACLTDGCVELKGIDMNDAQGDKILVNILLEMGADIQVLPKSLIIRGGKPLKGVCIDAKDIPDLLPILAVIGTVAKNKTQICNVKHARIKETDRIHSMTNGLSRLGATIEEHLDGMTIYQSKLTGNLVNGYDDHRTVMALSIAGLIASGTTLIEDGNAINKTFPTYLECMGSIGAKMELADVITQ